MTGQTRRWNGWGFADVTFTLPDAARTWLSHRLGDGEAMAAVAEAAILLPDARPVGDLGAAVASDPSRRLRHACGASFPDLVALRTGTVTAFPDAVAFPETAGEVAAVLRAATAAGVRVVVRGGGTSVVGGVTVVPDDRPVVVLSLDRLSGLTSLDPVSRLAGFGAGTLGPAVEAALAPHGLRLGHEPQSFELSSVGGWVATRSAGQRSTGIGKIDELVAGLEVATVDGLWRLPALPASAAGPELRRLIVGSEGRFGVITEATLRVRPLPMHEDGVVVLMPGWEAGVTVCRELVQAGVAVEVLRLSDPTETSFAQTLIHMSPVAARVSGLLFRTKRFREGCALLLGWTGTPAEVRSARLAAAEIWRAHGGLAVGRGGWRRWRGDRFHHPYLRDTLLGQGWGVDTFETAATWSDLPALHASVRAALDEAGRSSGLGVAVLCHLSHAYADGASHYFTFFWPLRAGHAVADWRALKEAATRGLLAAGGTLTHHHGVGTMHAPYLADEIGPHGLHVLRAVAAASDPAGTLNPGVLIGGREDRGQGTGNRGLEDRGQGTGDWGQGDRTQDESGLQSAEGRADCPPSPVPRPPGGREGD